MLRWEKQKHRGVESLMEGIILQCIADLWIGEEIDACIQFFRGEGFAVCAKIAGMNLHDQVKVLNLANRIIDRHTALRDKQKRTENKKRIFHSCNAGASEYEFAGNCNGRIIQGEVRAI